MSTKAGKAKAARRLVLLACIVVLAGACGARPTAPVPSPPPSPAAVMPTSTAAPAQVTASATPVAPAVDLTYDEAATLASLEQVDGYPLYVMHYQGAYSSESSLPAGRASWGCSLFAALAAPDGRLYGRNFDWEFSPALLLFADPPDGYASVSMVDLTFLGFDEAQARRLTELPADELRALLGAPFLPFDGMNDQGLAIGMAAVPDGGMTPDPARESIGSVGVIREMLDHAASVDEAVAIIQKYNVDMTGGPPIHYLIADRAGRAALVEYYQGQTVVRPNEQPWHLATNFIRASVGESAAGQCARYDRLAARLEEAAGRLDRHAAMDLLSQVANVGTQWSVVYSMSTGDVDVVMGRQYGAPHTWRLAPAAGSLP